LSGTILDLNRELALRGIETVYLGYIDIESLPPRMGTYAEVKADFLENHNFDLTHSKIGFAIPVPEDAMVAMKRGYSGFRFDALRQYVKDKGHKQVFGQWHNRGAYFRGGRSMLREHYRLGFCIR